MTIIADQRRLVVMITMMTAIVVIVLLGVFQDAVVNAVKNAFDSISGSGTAPSTP